MAAPVTAKFGKMRVLLGEQEGAAAVAATNLTNTSPAVMTVGAGDIAKFNNGDIVNVIGAVGDMSTANGEHSISSVGTPSNSFTLSGVNLAGAAAPATTGLTVEPSPSGPIIYGAPCGLTTKNLTISKNLQEVNIPDCDDPDAPIWLGRDVQNLSCTISGDGVAAAESVPDWNDAAMSTVSIPMKVEIEFSSGQKTFEGLFIVDNLAFNAEQGGRVTLSFNAQSDGEISDVWTPTP